MSQGSRIWPPEGRQGLGRVAESNGRFEGIAQIPLDTKALLDQVRCVLNTPLPHSQPGERAEHNAFQEPIASRPRLLKGVFVDNTRRRQVAYLGGCPCQGAGGPHGTQFVTDVTEQLHALLEHRTCARPVTPFA